MWPWEHAAVGYVLLSFITRYYWKRPPSDRGVIILLVGTQLPDLVDKPLSWGFGMFPSGYSVAHSVFIAVPVGVIILVVAGRRENLNLGVSFVIGYWSHLLADIAPVTRHHGLPYFERVLWPLIRLEPYETEYGLRRGLVYFQELLTEVSMMQPTTVVIVYFILPGGALLLWIIDELPGFTPVKNQFLRLRR